MRLSSVNAHIKVIYIYIYLMQQSNLTERTYSEMEDEFLFYFINFFYRYYEVIH